MRRSQKSIRHMLQRLGGNAKMGKDRHSRLPCPCKLLKTSESITIYRLDLTFQKKTRKKSASRKDTDTVRELITSDGICWLAHDSGLLFVLKRLLSPRQRGVSVKRCK